VITQSRELGGDRGRSEGRQEAAGSLQGQRGWSAALWARTVLACVAMLAGVPADQAVGWVRTHYDPLAIETPAQEQWVQWFAGYTRRLPTCQ